ncbi:MFS transporter [Arthrobacter sp. I2-34]|uniref:MFS transporter n=1 Tax=Arthrobacter hankyongi TaxID=2904801 RepID=A0ABS9L5G1_9MICC|nr:MFS transporter [Arthrobacter hankyongi]MCG2621875.1 MFS transporter [Arthrobacter hankyongi]
MSQDHGTRTSQPSLPPQAPPSSGRSGRTAGTLAAASLAVMIAQVANALPGALNGEYQLTFNTFGSQLTWITAAFMIPVVVFELTFGVLGDKFGHRKLVVGGAALVVIGSLVCTISPTVQAMWVGSALNGLGAGAIYPASLALVASVARTMQERVRGIAIWAGFLSAGSAISPLLGGVFAGFGWWRGAYAVVAVFSVAALVLTLFRAQEAKVAEGRRLDLWGQITLALGLILVLFGLVQGPEDGWGSTHVVASLAAGAALLAVFVVIELRVQSPLLDLRVFRNRQFTVASIVAVVGMFAFLGACFSTSMWLGPVQHQNPLYLGLLFLLLQGPAFVLIPVISRLQARISSRWLLTFGFLAMGAGALTASTFDVANRDVAVFILPSLLVGLGFALTLSPMTAIAVNSVPRQLTGMASATTNLLRDLGFALGPVLVGAIALSTAGSHLVPALQSSGLPADQLGPALGIAEAGGPIALNSLPPGVPGAEASQFALEALGSGFTEAFLVVAVSALAAALLSWFGLGGTGQADPEHEPEAVEAGR